MTPIPRCSGYYADADGRLWSDRKRHDVVGVREIFGHKGNRGYQVVRVVEDGMAVKRKVHTLVARAFLGEIPHGMQIRHLDCNKLNNSLSNLAYGTAQENAGDCRKNGHLGRHRADFDPGDLPWIRTYLLLRYPVSRVASVFGVGVGRLAALQIWS